MDLQQVKMCWGKKKILKNFKTTQELSGDIFLTLWDLLRTQNRFSKKKFVIFLKKN